MEVHWVLVVAQHLQQLRQLQLDISGNLLLEEVHGVISEVPLPKLIHLPTILQSKLDLRELHLLIMMQMVMEFSTNQPHAQEQIPIF